MEKRKAVERVVERVYRDRLKRTGRLPDSSEIESKVKKAAESADKNSKRDQHERGQNR